MSDNGTTLTNQHDVTLDQQPPEQPREIEACPKHLQHSILRTNP